ncbi:MAG: septum formation initiator family protein [Bacteroidota bacterium]
MSRLKNLLRNKYFLVLLLASVWIVFFDNYNLRAQLKMTQRIEQLEHDKLHYQEKIEALDFERDQLFSNPEELERFAREHYFMKKRGEEVFIIGE